MNSATRSTIEPVAASQALREVARNLIAQLEATVAQRVRLPTLELIGIGK